MKMSLALLICAICQTFTPSARANSTDWTRFEDYKIHLKVSGEWRIERDLYGMPITVLGPERNGERAVLNIQHTQFRNFQINHEVIQKTQKDYFSGRKEWLGKKPGARFISEIPYQKLNLQNGNDGYELGFRYVMDGKTFEERSVEMVCHDRLFFVKTLWTSQEGEQDKAVLADLVKQLDCAEVTARDGKYEPSELSRIPQKVSDYLRQNEWPNLEQIKKSDVHAKAQMIESLVEFYKDFEEAAGDELYSKRRNDESGNDEDGVYAHFKVMMQKLNVSLGESANADDNYSCFFGGWPSQYIMKNGKQTCASPLDKNETYKSQYMKSCGDQQLLCNPALFGDGICISTATAEERSHATVWCEAEFRRDAAARKEEKPFEKLVADPKFNAELFTETLQSAETVCTDSHYVSENSGLCATLRVKLDGAVNAGKVKLDEKNPLTQSVQSGDYKKVEATFKTFDEFADHCIDKDKKPIQTEECVNNLHRMTREWNTMERARQAAEKDLSSDDEKKESANKACATCGNGTTNPPADEVRGEDGCTQADHIRIKKDECTVGSVIGHGLGQMVSAIAASLVSTVKGLVDLAVSAAKWTGNKIAQGWNWLVGKKSVEDQTADKAHAASQTSNSFLKELILHPINTIVNMIPSIIRGITGFITNDLLCTKWSSVPHLSTCMEPGNIGCLSCLQKVDAFSGLIGYVAAEFIPAMITGGFVGAGMGEKLTAWLGKMRKSKKVIEAGEAAEELAKAEQVAEKVKKTSKFMNFAKGSKTAIADLTTTTASKVKNLTLLKKLSAFKNRITGGYKSTLKWLNEASATIAKKAPLPVAAVKVVSKPVAAIGKMVANLPGKLVRGTANVITFPLRKISKLEVNAYNRGLEIGERLASRKVVQKAAVDEAEKLSARVPGVYREMAGLGQTSKARELSLKAKALLLVEQGAKYTPSFKRQRAATLKAINENRKLQGEAGDLLNPDPAKMNPTEKVELSIDNEKDYSESDFKTYAEARAKAGVDETTARAELFQMKITTIEAGLNPVFNETEISLWAKANNIPDQKKDQVFKAYIDEVKKQAAEARKKPALDSNPQEGDQDPAASQRQQKTK